jgi:hypothetical protein
MLAKDLFKILREHSGNNQGTIREHSGNIQSDFFTTPKICTGVCMRKRRSLKLFGEQDWCWQFVLKKKVHQFAKMVGWHQYMLWLGTVMIPNSNNKSTLKRYVDDKRKEADPKGWSKVRSKVLVTALGENGPLRPRGPIRWCHMSIFDTCHTDMREKAFPR